MPSSSPISSAAPGSQTVPPPRLGFDWQLFRRLFRRTLPYRGKLTIVLVTSTIRAFQRPLLFWAVAEVINGPIAAHDYPGTLRATLYFLLLALSTALVLHLRSRHQNELGELLVHDLREELYANLQRQPLGYFHKVKLGRILSRVVSDLESTRRGIQLVVFIAQEFLQIAICCVLMAGMNPLLFGVILLFAPLLLWGSRRFTPRIHKLSKLSAESHSQVTGVLAEAVRGIRVIQGFSRQQRSDAAFSAQVQKLTSQNVSLGTESALFAPMLGLTGQIFLAALLLVGGYGALHGFAGLTVEKLVSFFFLPTSFFLSVQTAAGYYPQILAAQVGTERVFDLIDLSPTWQDEETAQDLADPRHGRDGLARPGMRIAFEHVTFSYVPGRPALQEISFAVEPGQTVALVGHTGSGKSTLVSLLAKFHLPDSGTIRLDGVDLRALSGRSARAQMGFVHQNNFLFTGSVRDNIRLGRPGASDAEVEEAIHQLDCMDLLLDLPQGLETEVGENGSQLSLGKRQIVCFARALLADPRLLLLDEATSAIDVVTETRIQRALARLLDRRTNLVVAHRLATIVHADLILVLAQGRIVERGTHQELLRSGGHYQSLYREFVSARTPARRAAGTAL